MALRRKCRAAAADRVVHKRVHCFLQNALLIAENDFRRHDVAQFYEAVVAVDDPAVEIVHIRCRMAAGLQGHHGPKRRRRDGDSGQKHPLGANACERHGANQRKSLSELLALRSTGFFKRRLQLHRKLLHIGSLKNLVDRFRTDTRFKERAVFHRKAVILYLIQNDAGAYLLNIRLRGRHQGAQFIARFVVRNGLELRLVFALKFAHGASALFLIHFGDDVAGKIDHFLRVGGGHAENQGDSRGNAPQEPNVRNGSRQFDVAHALAAHDGARYFDTALFADNSPETRPFIFPAVTFKIPLRTENPFIKKTVLLRPLGAVVDGFGLLHFPP